MADSTFCSVCFEEYTETGSKCPKLLPCSHTLCNSCCWKFSQRKSVQRPRLNFQCPECRAFHWVPVSGFPTNRYALQILDMQRKLIESESKKQIEKATIAPEQAKHEKCKVHGKPCVMFCLRKECWKALCPKCPVQEHQKHDVVGLSECINDPEELEKMKQDVIKGGNSLKFYVSLLEVCKANVLKNANEVNEDIQKIATGMKNQIEAKARELTKNVQRNSDKQVAELEAVQKTISKDLSSGKQIELDINFHRVSVSVEGLIDIRNRCDDFKKSVERKRKMKMDYTLVHLNRNKRQKLNYCSLIGKVDLTTKRAK